MTLVVACARAGSVGAALADRLEARGARLVRVSSAGEAARREVLAQVQPAGRLDVLVLDAGDGPDAPVEELDPATAARALEHGFDGPVALAQAVWPQLVAARGRLICISSELGVTASVHRTARSASEHALVGWSRALAAAARGEGVHVLTVHAAGAGGAAAARAAEGVLRALDAGRYECFVPARLRLAAAVQAVLPGSAARLLAGRR